MDGDLMARKTMEIPATKEGQKGLIVELFNKIYSENKRVFDTLKLY
jgi:hypothetical protein